MAMTVSTATLPNVSHVKFSKRQTVVSHISVPNVSHVLIIISKRTTVVSHNAIGFEGKDHEKVTAIMTNNFLVISKSLNQQG